MKGKIYTVAIKVTYEQNCFKFTWKGFPVQLSKRINAEITEDRPVFAYSPEDAVKKYKEIYPWKDYLRFKTRFITVASVAVEVISEINDYSIDYLKCYMNSQDFLEYVRQEFSIINEVIK